MSLWGVSEALSRVSVERLKGPRNLISEMAFNLMFLSDFFSAFKSPSSFGSDFGFGFESGVCFVAFGVSKSDVYYVVLWSESGFV